MALPGERDYQGPTCEDCGGPIPLRVCSSAAGYYVGQWCDNCGPYGRMSGYFRKREQAERELESIKRSEDL
jgi:hypothetical protein